MSGFGQYVSNDYTKVKNGSYPATIVSAKLVMEDGKPKEIVSDGGAKKKSVRVDFQLDKESDDGAIEIGRPYTLTYGKNKQTGAYAGWAVLIEAATGFKCGDTAQRNVGQEELEGRRVLLRIKNVEANGNKYSNVVDVEELEEDEQLKTGPHYNPPGEDDASIPF